MTTTPVSAGKMGAGLCVVTVGINHKSAGLDAAGRQQLDEAGVRQALKRLRGRFREALVISTCGRTEATVLTAHPDRAAFAALEEAGILAISPGSARLREGYFELRDRAAVAHLFRVAAGLESMLVGEREILGQVRRAAEIARGVDALGPVLSRLTGMAVATGRRVRRETGVEAASTSFGSAIVRLSRGRLGSLEGMRLLVVGAGQAAEAVLEAFGNEPLAERLVANRSAGRARGLATNFRCRALTLQAAAEAARTADILVLATSAADRRSYITKAQSSGAAKPRAVFDLGPAQIDVEGAAARPDWTLKEIYRESNSGEGIGPEAISRAVAIIDEETSEFFGWWAREDVVPVVQRLLAQTDAIQEAEIEAALRKLGPLTERQQELIRGLASGIVKKVLHGPLSRMRRGARGRYLARAAAELFGVEAGEPLPEPEASGPEASETDWAERV